jgi:YWFCY protein/TraM recognition site of TraD and TraG
MSQSSSSPLRNVAHMSLVISIVLLLLHLYYSCYSLFDQWGLTSKISDRVLTHIATTRLFESELWCKTVIVFFLALSMIATSGRKDQRTSWRAPLRLVIAGLVVYFSSFMIFARLGSPTTTGVSYILFTTGGWLMVLMGGTRLRRYIKAPLAADDPFGEAEAGFPQEERQLVSAHSLHLRGRYTLRGKERESWINLVNPRRGVLIIGSPGSGKSWFIIEPLMRQWMEKGRVLFLYDFKYDKLTRYAFRLYKQYHQRFPRNTAFHSINFTDLSRSHRCNVLARNTLGSIADAIGASRTILLSINKSWVHRQGEFFVESPIAILAALIWRLRNYEDGKYCTLPHVIELSMLPYPRVFSMLQGDTQCRGLVQPFVDAYKSKAMEMLEGQVASMRIPMGRLASPDIYYVLTGNDFSLAINDPKAPTVFCLGGDPKRQEALGPVLSLYVDRLSRLVNQPEQLPCALFCDEFATIRAYTMTTTIATARENNIVPVLAVQDVSQLRTQYSKEEADVFLNVSANLFCGQSSGETARWVSDQFPKVQKDKRTVSNNSADTSVSVSQQSEPAVTPATVATLSSGEFLGILADDPGQKMPLKAFHAQLIREEADAATDLPALPQFSYMDEDIARENFDRVKREVEDLVEKEIIRMGKDEQLRKLIIK